MPEEYDEYIGSIYTSFKDDARGWLALHRQHFTQFVTIILAILAASMTALYNLSGEGPLLLLVAFGPGLNIVLSVLAIRVCDKFYLRYWEHETASYKLYGLMNERHNIDSRIEAGKQIFRGDHHLFPQRWLDRVAEYETCDEFVKARLTAPDSSNRFIHITFWALICISSVVCAAIVILSIVNMTSAIS